MIKRFVFSVIAMTMAFAASAQLNVFNHLGADLSVSTAGIGVEASTPITPWIQLRAGVNVMPGFTFKTDVDGEVMVQTASELYNQDINVDVTGNFGRTQGDVIVNIYPFGPKSSFFIAGGAYFGGKALVKVKGHSDQVANWQADGTLKEGYIEIGDYNLNFEKGGNIRGGIITKNFRPYLGLGFGRPCPGKRLGFMFELGVQFMGKVKIGQGSNYDPIKPTGDNNDDWQKVMNKINVYPMLKFTLSGRIF